MREIKFRAWTKERAVWKMLYSDNFDIHIEVTDKAFVTDGGGPHEGIVYEHKSIMQFTGLKDKNGKDIYEGDIVKIGVWEDKIESYEWYTGEVVFEKGAFLIGCNELSDSFDYFTYLEDDQVEVMSNIHENSELIK